MTVDNTRSSQHDRPQTGVRQPGIGRAIRVVVWLLAAAVFAQAVLAGLFLDGGDAWRAWHAVNGVLVVPLLALIQVGLAVLVWRRGRGPGWLPVTSVGLLALLVQSALGMTSQVAAHVPLGVAIFGLIGTLLVRTQTATSSATQRLRPGGWPRPDTTGPADPYPTTRGAP
jgi:cytochrome bd-type quinol oxidase subunit 2